MRVIAMPNTLFYRLECNEKGVLEQGELTTVFVVARLIDLSDDAEYPALMTQAIQSGQDFKYFDNGLNVTVNATGFNDD